MTLETAFNIVLQRASTNMKRIPRKEIKRRKDAQDAWAMVSDYALNEAANNPEWRD